MAFDHDQRRATASQGAKLLVAGLVAAAFAGAAHAQVFPSRPVRILTPFPAGAGPNAESAKYAGVIKRATVSLD